MKQRHTFLLLLAIMTLALSCEQKDSVDNNMPLILRSMPVQNLQTNDVKKMIKEKGFYHRDWNPNGKGVPYQYEKKKIGGNDVVIDYSTGLIWQHSGSEKLSLEEAYNYIAQLNQRKFAGFSDWRLPTLEEAMTLMQRKTTRGIYHMALVFDKNPAEIWTADKKDIMHAWVVTYYLGKCGWLSIYGYDGEYGTGPGVRAVRTIY